MINKKYVWCFMGQTHKQGAREQMLEDLKQVDGEYFCNVNSTWQSSDSLSTQEYKEILRDSVFAPCPRGNSCADTFRLYEAIESGAIPIVERDSYWRNMFGEDHPLIETSDWQKTARDISVLAQHSEWTQNHLESIQTWWRKQKNNLKQTISAAIQLDSTIDNRLSIKQQQLQQLVNQWVNFKDYDFLNYICREMPKPKMTQKKFSVYNPGQKIAVVSLYTREIADYAVCSEQSVREYCERQGYTFYVYRDTLDANANANWSKARALLNHFDDHETIVWMDSDTIVYNPDKRFEDILDKCSAVKRIIACKDIGSDNKNMPKGSMLNSGVVIFRTHTYTKNIIKKWMNFDGDKSSLYASGGDQEILCDVLKRSDGFGFNRKIFPMNKFNTEPRFVDENTFIVHFMAYPKQLKTIFMNYWVSR